MDVELQSLITTTHNNTRAKSKGQLTVPASQQPGGHGYILN